MNNLPKHQTAAPNAAASAVWQALLPLLIIRRTFHRKFLSYVSVLFKIHAQLLDQTWALHCPQATFGPLVDSDRPV